MVHAAALSQIPTGLLLVGHGSREQIGVDEFLAVAGLVADLVEPIPVEPCFLEFAQPAIATGFEKLAARGARRIVVVPVLLFAAGHAKRDIPQAVAAVAAEQPQIEVCQSEPFGCHDEILKLSQGRFDEALADSRLPPSAPTLLVLVGRGSHDPEATAHMRQFLGLRAEQAELMAAEVAFVAMAEPRLDDVLEWAAASAAERIVVQPHLLFGGVLLDRINDRVAECRRRWPDKEWLTAVHLGPSRLLAAAIRSRALKTLSS